MLIKDDQGPKGKCRVSIYGGLNEIVAHAGEVWPRRSCRHAINMGVWTEGHKPVLERGYFRQWSDITEAIQTPWKDGLEIIKKMAAELKKIKLPLPKSIRRTPVYTFEGGDEVDYDKMRGGVEFWRACRREQAKGPNMLTILTDVTTSSYVNSEDILWRGAAALALTNILQEQGYRIELWGYQHVSEGFMSGKDFFTGVCMKPLSAPLNINALICGVAGWFYRTVYFASYLAHEDDMPESGLGHPKHGITDWQKKLITTEKDPIIILNCWDFRSAVKCAATWLKKIIGEQKVDEKELMDSDLWKAARGKKYDRYL